MRPNAQQKLNVPANRSLIASVHNDATSVLASHDNMLAVQQHRTDICRGHAPSTGLTGLVCAGHAPECTGVPHRCASSKAPNYRRHQPACTAWLQSSSTFARVALARLAYLLLHAQLVHVQCHVEPQWHDALQIVPGIQVNLPNLVCYTARSWGCRREQASCLIDIWVTSLTSTAQ